MVVVCQVGFGVYVCVGGVWLELCGGGFGCYDN